MIAFRIFKKACEPWIWWVGPWDLIWACIHGKLGDGVFPHMRNADRQTDRHDGGSYAQSCTLGYQTAGLVLLLHEDWQTECETGFSGQDGGNIYRRSGSPFMETGLSDWMAVPVQIFAIHFMLLCCLCFLCTQTSSGPAVCLPREILMRYFFFIRKLIFLHLFQRLPNSIL